MAEMTMFHFLCPICGSNPNPEPLRPYIRKWGASGPNRLSLLLGCVYGALREVREGDSGWLTQRFRKASEKFEMSLPESLQVGLDSRLAGSGRKIFFEGCCPACGEAAGPRKAGGYFREWRSACKVQTGNLIYESGLVLWGILKALPEWADGATLSDINAVRLGLAKVGRSLSLMECSHCGRFTNCLYGEESTGSCRWCLDMAGGGGTFVISLEEDGSIDVDTGTGKDFSSPASSVWDLLPPEFESRRGKEDAPG